MTKQEFMAFSLPYGVKVLYSNNDRIDIQKLLPMHFDCGLNLVNESGKPILHPLSDLTKEIEHKGERFVPINYNAFKHDKESLLELMGGFAHYKSIKFGIIQKLIEWHFDIANLIEKGEAIDINTLETNPYKN